MSIVIFHTADWGYSVDPEHSKQRLLRSDWIGRLFSRAASEADMVLVSGDMFRGEIQRPDDAHLRAAQELLNKFRQSSAAPVIILDSTTHRAGKNLDLLADVRGVSVFRKRSNKPLPVQTVRTGGGTVHVVPVVLRTHKSDKKKQDARRDYNHRKLGQARRLVLEGREADPRAYWVAMLHGQSGDFKTRMLKKLGEAGCFDYLALGDRDSARGTQGDLLRRPPKYEDNCRVDLGKQRALACHPGRPTHDVASLRGEPRFIEVRLSQERVAATQHPWKDVYELARC